MGPLLLMDTCGERASLALFRGEELVAERTLAERSGSAGLLPALREMLSGAALELKDVAALGVVSGPGSFTGVRLGLSVAKGLCEASGLRLAAVSRLAVLANAAGVGRGWVLLGAGRDQVYARPVKDPEGGGERLFPLAAVASLLQGAETVVDSEDLATRLRHSGATVRVWELAAKDALGSARRCLAAGGTDPASLDANYVRDGSAIYASKAKPVQPFGRVGL